MRWAAALSVTAGALALAPSAGAAPVSVLHHPCNNRDAPGVISISYSGRSNCAEAKLVSQRATNDGRRAARREARTVRLPHSTWRCTTIRRSEAHGELLTRWRTTCTLRGSTHATVRWFVD